jgi:hypothetical protein
MTLAGFTDLLLYRLQGLECKWTIGASCFQLDYSSLGFCIDVAHDGDFMLILYDISLIDRDGINPDDSG